MKSLLHFPLLIVLFSMLVLLTTHVKAESFSEKENLVQVEVANGATGWLTIEDAAPQLSAEGRIPVIMVHGWSFSGKPAPPGTGFWDYHLSFLLNDPEMSKYFKPYYVRYWSNAVTVNELGGFLRDKIQLAGLHEKPFILIAHSMGGLVSRSFMNEHVFTTGKYAGVTCGELVKLLLTLGTPHHGSPMANGPARDEKVSFLLRLYMSAVESVVFSDTKYNEVNRSDLRWDNYDNLFNYTKYSSEKNDWLTNLNSNTQYDSKLICYAASVTGQFLLPPYNTTDEQYKVGAYVMSETFGFDNDGIVPYQSSTFDRHAPKKIRFFDEYTHADIAKGKGSETVLFASVKEDFLEVVPPTLLWPVDTALALKHSEIKEIKWDAPSSIKAINIYFSGDNGYTFIKIANDIDASLKSYLWSVPDTNLTQCIIKITKASDESLSSQLTTPFTIYHNRVTFLNPLVKGYFAPDKSNKIQWNQTGISTYLSLTYFDPKNAIERVIAENIPVQQAINNLEWQPDSSILASDSSYLIIKLNGMESFSDTTDYLFISQPFTMLGFPRIVAVSPSENPIDIDGFMGEKMEIGTNYTVRWTTEGEIKFVKISLCDSVQNIIQEIRKKNHNPGIHSTGSFSWKVPSIYGNKFYLRLDAGRSEHEISTSCMTPYSFRINRPIEIISPTEESDSVGLIPCLSVKPVESATSYSFVLVGQSPSSIGCNRTFSSTNPDLCFSGSVEDELNAGSSYVLTAWAMFDSIRSYTSSIHFKTEAIRPYSFRLITPENGDTIWDDNVSYVWGRSVGAVKYRFQLLHQNKLIVDEDFGRADTSLTLLMNKKGYADTLFWKVTAENDFGEKTSSGYFFNKDHVGNTFLKESDKFNLGCYPNPISNHGFIEFTLKEKALGNHVSLSVQTLSGQRIYSLVEGVLRGGKHKIEFENSNLSLRKGVYFIVLEVDGVFEVCRIMVQ